MSKILNFKLLSSTAAVLYMASCNTENVKISGTFHGKPDNTIFIEQLSPNKRIVDSVKTNSKGNFSYNYKMMGDDQSQFINLKLGDKFITLLVEKGERVKINSIYNISGSYDVEGSKGSQLVKELNSDVIKNSNTIDSLYTIFNQLTDTTARKEISREISKTYIDHKRNSIRFIVENNKSLASIMALYQRMPNGILVFNDTSDFPYFKMVCDSIESVYPNSLHVKTLKADILNFQNKNSLANMVNSRIASNEEASIPDIKINDMFGKEQSLSSLKGKVVLLSFWSAAQQNSALLNSELKEIYKAYKDKGFEIYQVSLDQSKAAWVSAVNTQALPWISVNDLKGASSANVMKYNINQLPANYLIDRNGDIIGKNLFGEDLVKSIAKNF